MRLEPAEPKSESDFYQDLRRRTGYDIYYERIEPSNESGFPDVYFALKPHFSAVTRPSEGTIELKFDKRKKPDLKSLLRGNQQSALLDYFEAGGRRRFALCYCNGIVYLWDTEGFYNEIRGKKDEWTAERIYHTQDEKNFELSVWLREVLWRDDA